MNVDLNIETVVMEVVIRTNNKGAVKIIPRDIKAKSLINLESKLRQYAPYLNKKIIKIKNLLKQKKINLYYQDRILLNVFEKPIEIYYEDIDLRRRDSFFYLTVKIKNFDLDYIINEIIERKFAEKMVLYDILKKVNNFSEKEQKYELIQAFFEWINRYQVTNVIMDFWGEHNKNIAKLLEKYEVKIEKIMLEIEMLDKVKKSSLSKPL